MDGATGVTAQEFHVGERSRSAKHLAPHNPMTPASQPRNREDATGLAFREHPAVMAAAFDVDVASTSIRVAESSLMPSITVQGSVSRSRDADPTLSTLGTDQASVIGALNQPIYDGGIATLYSQRSMPRLLL